MSVFDRTRRAVRSCFRSRLRATLSVLFLLAIAISSWHGVRLWRGHNAYKQAEAALVDYKFAEAREHLKLACELRPRKAEVWLLAAQTARRADDITEAKSHLRRYKALAGETPESRLEGSLQDVQLGEIERDVYDLLAKIDAEHPATEQILEALAVGSVHVYHFNRAGFWLGYLLDRYPKNPIGRLIRAQMDDVLGKHDRAEAVCRELLVDFPDNNKAKSLLAGFLGRAQRFEEAIELYEDLRTRQPDALTPLLGLARCRSRMSKPELARPLMRELEEKFPESAEGLLECGRFALAENRLEDAERILSRAVQLAPTDHEILYQYGLCLERAGKAELAKLNFERLKVIEADMVRMNELLKIVVNRPLDPVPRREAASICIRNGQSVEALRWLRGALEVAPNDKATHAAMADFLGAQGDNYGSSYHRQRAR